MDATGNAAGNAAIPGGIEAGKGRQDAGDPEAGSAAIPGGIEAGKGRQDAGDPEAGRMPAILRSAGCRRSQGIPGIGRVFCDEAFEKAN